MEIEKSSGLNLKPLDFTLIILMAGSSQRFTAAGMNLPKALLLADGQIVLERIISSFRTANRIVIIANSEQESVLQDWLSRKSNLEAEAIEIVYITRHNLGPSYSIYRASEVLTSNQPYVVTYCDVWVQFDLKLFIQKLRNYEMGFVGMEGFHPYLLREPKFGYVKCDSLGNVIDVKEKERFDDSDNKPLASAGVYGFRDGSSLVRLVKDQIDSNLKVFGEFYLSLAALPIARLRNQKVFFQRAQKFYSWGTPEELTDFNYFTSVFRALGRDKSIENQVPGDLVLVAAGASSRTIEGFLHLPKQLLKVSQTGGLLLFEFVKHFNFNAAIMVVVSNALSENLPINEIPKDHDIQVILPKHSTKNACETALLGLSKLEKSSSQISVASTDNLIQFDYLDKDIFGEADLVVWVANYYPVSDHDPTNYSWVRLNDSGRVEEISIKFRPDDGEDWRMVIGNFTFKSRDVSIELLETTLRENFGQVTEVHLESIISIALKHELYVSSHMVPFYFTIGSRVEQDIYNYYALNSIDL